MTIDEVSSLSYNIKVWKNNISNHKKDIFLDSFKCPSGGILSRTVVESIIDGKYSVENANIGNNSNPYRAGDGEMNYHIYGTNIKVKGSEISKVKKSYSEYEEAYRSAMVELDRRIDQMTKFATTVKNKHGEIVDLFTAENRSQRLIFKNRKKISKMIKKSIQSCKDTMNMDTKIINNIK